MMQRNKDQFFNLNMTKIYLQNYMFINKQNQFISLAISIRASLYVTIINLIKISNYSLSWLIKIAILNAKFNFELK